MPEEATPAPEEIQDTPAQETETPVEDTSPAPVVDYEQRYNNLRPEFDRTKQQLREYEEQLQALQTQEQAPEDDEDYEYEYEDSVARQGLERIETLLAERDEQATLERQHAEATSHIDSELTALETEYSEEFSDSEAEWIGTRAYALRDENGKPDVRAAYDAFNKMLEGRKAKWTKTKKAPKVNSGPPAAQIQELDTSQKRADYIDQQIHDREVESF